MKRFSFSLITLAVALSSWAWSQKGHDVTAYIAEKHLTPATAAAVDSILDGMSMVYWANWLDNASHTPEYAYTKTWHYKNVNEGVRYEEMGVNPAGDVVTGIKSRMEVLMNPKSTAEERNLAMKILVHLVGDMHQPMHMGHATDLGGNRTKVKFFGRDTNLHSVWDSNIVESGHKWGYSDWQEQIDRVSPAEEESLIDGTVDDWAKETVYIAASVYNNTPAGTNLMYNEVAQWTPVVEKQLLRGGLRLAHVLNMIFDADYAASHSWPYTPAL
ncbi:MAG: S1/P1 nuclease [Paramuribaculum sp.]|nr:S1/P1 nuclease [Paramuribaculum sp.]